MHPGRSGVYNGRVCDSILKETQRSGNRTRSPVQAGQTSGQAQKTNTPAVERHPVGDALRDS